MLKTVSTIMIIDDNSDFVELLKDGFLEFFTTVKDYSSAKAALSDLEQGTHPDLILTDYNMPEMSGRDFLNTLRVLSVNCPVVLITGDINQAVKDTVKDFPKTLVLEKPFDIDALAQKMHQRLKNLESA